VVTLDPSAAGGIEKPLGVQHQIIEEQEQPTASTWSSSHEPTTIPPVPSGFGRIIRDAAGNVLGVEMNEKQEDESKDAVTFPQDDVVMDDVESRIDRGVRQRWATDFSRSTASHFGAKDDKLVQSECLLGMLSIHLPIPWCLLTYFLLAKVNYPSVFLSFRMQIAFKFPTRCQRLRLR